MDGNVMNDASPAPETSGWPWIGDLWRIGFIALMSLATRSWVVAHAEVVSRDGVGFIRYALQLEDPPPSTAHPGQPMTFAEVLRKSDHPPGYAVAILAVSQPVRAIMGGTSSTSMVLSAQIASVLASLLLTLPMYFLGKMLFNRPIAFVATLIFQVLPVNTQVACDGLSDSLFLLTSVTALWFAAIGFRRTSAAWFALAGMTSGLSYLVRPEGLIVVLVAGLVMIWCKVRGDSSWRLLLARSGALAAGTLIMAGPYVATIGRLTNKNTGEGLLHWLQGEEMKPGWISTPQSARPTTVGFPLADYYHDAITGQKPGAGWAGQALAKELLKASFYVLPLFSAIGFALLWPRVRGDAAVLLLVALGLCNTLLLFAVAMGAGYVAERHTLLIVLCGSYFAAASFPLLGERLASISRLRRIGGASFWASFIAVAFVAASAPASLKTLHAGRSGHREAGFWIAAQHEPSAMILDPFAWCEFYAGNIRLPSTSSDGTQVVYSVMEKGVNEHQRLHMMKFARYFSERSPLVYQWPENVPVNQVKVQVFCWRGEDLAAMMHQADKSGP
jgi:Dolichyl-phosphate-mannose-protein mannosyltransferase